ncbi:MAG: hypothetical protein HGA45_36930 [Chloroflexales bacterium]|nr:hypothetical protein [Chloroflexales bacterium]
MRSRLLSAALFACAALLVTGLLAAPGPAAAQSQAGRVQRIAGQLDAGEIDAYLLRALLPGDRLTVSMRSTSGNLDPAIGIVDTSAPIDELIARYRAEIQRLLAESAEVAPALNDLRGRYFLAWDDDAGVGYAAALEYVVPAAGDYALVAAGSLSALGRATAGEYELVIGLNGPDVREGTVAPTGAPIAEPLPISAYPTPAVEESTGALGAETPVVNVRLADLDAGETLFVYAEATAGNLRPSVILRDFGGKALEAGNLGGQEPQATLAYTPTDPAAGFSLDVRAAALADGTPSAGDYRLLVGVNAPEVLSGQAQPQGDKVIAAPTEVRAGLQIHRISEVDSQNENYTVLGSLRMDWVDPRLAFSPDACGCPVKLYNEKEFDRFLAEVQSRWPDFSFFNQLGNRWVKTRAAAIWPDGRVRYAESFSATFQADFDFQKYPFDVQTFPIYLDMLYPAYMYTLVDLPGYSGIDPEHGEDEFIIAALTTAVSAAAPSAADSPVTRMTFSFSAPRHLNYYVLQVFVPIVLIILISWFTFFLRDYSRRIEAAAANILLFIAFNFSLADNYPRLGYITFLDAVMSVTFVVNVLVLLYNVQLKRLENRGQSQRAERIDTILDWAYPLSYVMLVGLIFLLFF